MCQEYKTQFLFSNILKFGEGDTHIDKQNKVINVMTEVIESQYLILGVGNGKAVRGSTKLCQGGP